LNSEEGAPVRDLFGDDKKKLCRQHPGTTVAYDGEACPLCTADARLGASTRAITEIGSAVVGFYIATGGRCGIVFQTEPLHEQIAGLVSQKVIAALEILAAAMKGGEASRIIRPSGPRIG
jgi:hypothetical protein